MIDSDDKRDRERKREREREKQIYRLTDNGSRGHIQENDIHLAATHLNMNVYVLPLIVGLLPTKVT